VPAAWRQPIIDLFDQTAELVESLYQHIGDTVIMPGSIALDKMDQAEFRTQSLSNPSPASNSLVTGKNTGKISKRADYGPLLTR
jgi:hypothetical protein